MIMDSQRNFFMNLYRSRNAKIDNAESSIFLDNPNLPSISYESRIICEGRITAEECQKVLKNFSICKKTSGSGISGSSKTGNRCAFAGSVRNSCSRSSSFERHLCKNKHDKLA